MRKVWKLKRAMRRRASLAAFLAFMLALGVYQVELINEAQVVYADHYDPSTNNEIGKKIPDSTLERFLSPGEFRGSSPDNKMTELYKNGTPKNDKSKVSSRNGFK